MFEIIEFKLKKLETMNSEERKKEITEIYMYLFGYYSSIVDSDMGNVRQFVNIVVEIDRKLMKLLGIKDYLNVGDAIIFNNVLKNINSIYESYKKEKVSKDKQKELMSLLEIFIKAYDYYAENDKNLTIFDCVFRTESRKLTKIMKYKNSADSYFTSV